ncbi:MAG: diacylglycerol kinase family lipid kinase [Clostridia bacterium]|nr:diacylglycerol kinase family lipid kinase [Clostridia bacterium]
MYYIIANETHLKGKGIQRLETVKKVFDVAGKKYEVLLTQKEGDAKRHAERITSLNEESTIIAMGGDGTLHDILNGIKDFDKCSVGLIPFGTGNDFAATAKIPNDVKKAAEIIAFKAPKSIDFIELASGLRSINSIGMGLDVDILKRVYSRKMRGHTKYARALIPCLLHFKSCNFTIKYDGKEEKHFGLISAVGNGKQLGGGIKLFPHAEIDDGYLDLLIVDYISKPKMIGAFIKLMLGKIDKIKKVTFVKTKAVTFVHEDENYTLQAEGELYDNVPLDAHIVENKLKFYLP